IVLGNGKHLPERCPSCWAGWLVERNGKNGVFFSCSTYPLCSYKEDACPECRKGAVKRRPDLTTVCDVCGRRGRVCPRCRRGVLVEKSGRFGPFLGCGLFGAEVNSCTHKENF